MQKSVKDVSTQEGGKEQGALSWEEEGEKGEVRGPDVCDQSSPSWGVSRVMSSEDPESHPLCCLLTGCGEPPPTRELQGGCRLNKRLEKMTPSRMSD